MKRFAIAVMLFLTTAIAYAAPKEAQPEVVPCATKDGTQFECLWDNTAWRQYMDRHNRRMVTVEGYFMTVCDPVGKCYHNRTRAVTGYSRQPIQAMVNRGYYLGLTVEGLPVAYREGTGPLVGQPAVSILEAGNKLYAFLLAQNYDNAAIQRLFAMNYPGGWAKYQSIAAEQLVVR